MRKRTPLTEEDKAAAQRLSNIWHAKKKALDLTQEKVAHLCGWKTQGAVSAYLLGRTPLNPVAVKKFADLLGVSPLEIAPHFAEHFQISGLPTGELSVLDVGILETILAAIDLYRTPLSHREQAQVIAEAYARAVLQQSSA